ncbi:MAG: 50S ribosomal protein L6 [Candidatus Zixiibacteriota bacterium]
MSRVGKEPVKIPQGVKVNLDGVRITVNGPKGELARDLHPNMSVAVDGEIISVTRPNDLKQNRALHGLTRALIQNMVTGVTEGYSKTLAMVGVGYRAEMKGKALSLAVGFSHPVIFRAPDGVSVSVGGKENIITLAGIDKQIVGDAAARIRKIRPPEPYKGKGIKYENEIIKRKAGKTAGA